MTTKAMTIKLTIAYDGTGFGGWQRQKNARSVQEDIENALLRMHGHPVPLTGAGRTDAGVHAMGQVACFVTDIASIPAGKFMPALNRLLPHDVRILGAEAAPDRFHARFDASLRRYRYFIACGAEPDPFTLRRAHHVRRQPRLDTLNAAAAAILGSHDFTAFSSAKDPSRSKRRFVTESWFYREGDLLVYQVAANAFLWRMVRSLTGTMLHFEAEEGHGPGAPARAAARMAALLESGDRKAAGPTAPAAGLFLWNVEYGPRTHGTLGPGQAPVEDATVEDATIDESEGDEAPQAPVQGGRRLVPGIGWVEG